MCSRGRFSNNDDDDHSSDAPPFSPAFPTMCLCGVRIAEITFIASITCLEAALFVVNSDHQSRVMKN